MSMPSEIVDPHHHLWRRDDIGDYLLEDLRVDIGELPVAQTVFVECRAGYRTEGPEHLRPVGETEFVAAEAERSERTPGAVIAGIVAKADLRLDPDRLDEVLDAHELAAGGRFRGIRDALSSARYPETLTIPGSAPAGLADDPNFRRGVARLGERGLTYDTWHYHHQNRELLGLARAVPGTTMVLDHFGTPLGVGPFAGRHDEIFPVWSADIAELATCDNVVAKLGGLAMPDNGFGWHETGPPTVEELVAAHERWYRTTIEAFGPDRCMFESNFPVDKFSVPYQTITEAQMVMAEPYSPAERADLFAGTARRVYRL